MATARTTKAPTGSIILLYSTLSRESRLSPRPSPQKLRRKILIIEKSVPRPTVIAKATLKKRWASSPARISVSLPKKPESKTDPDARLYAKGSHQEAKLRYMVHNLMDV